MVDPVRIEQQPDDLVASVNGLAETWSEIVSAILWQSTVVFAVVAIVVMTLRRRSPRVRFWLWQVVVVKFLVMPFWTADRLTNVVSGPQPAEQSTKAPKIELAMSSLTTESALGGRSVLQAIRDLTWHAWLFLAWIAIVAIQCGRLVRLRSGLTRLLSSTQPADARLRQMATRAADQLRLRRTVSVMVTDEDCSPFVCGVWRPRLVLPRPLTHQLDEAQLTHVLLHELAHVKRCDLVWSWIPEIARVFYFFHPLVHYVNSRIRLERELCCDEYAMLVSRASAADYADTLVTVVSHATVPALLQTATVTSAGLSGECGST